MSDKILGSVLKGHNEIISRLEEHESKSRKNKNYLTAVALTAVLGGGGGATALINNDDDSVKTVVATHVAVYEEWKPKISEDIDLLQAQVSKLTSITAFLSGGGSTNIVEEDSMKTAMAAHVAVYEEWKPEVSSNVEVLKHQVTNLREAMIRIQVTIEGLSEKHRGGSGELKSRLDEVESLLNEVDKFNQERERGLEEDIRPAPERIRQLRKSLFDD